MLVRTSSGMPSLATNSRSCGAASELPATLKNANGGELHLNLAVRLDDVEDGLHLTGLCQHREESESLLRVSSIFASQAINRLRSDTCLHARLRKGLAEFAGRQFSLHRV